MNIQHKQLANGRWTAMPLIEQMANIGSEIERAINWKNKLNKDYCINSFNRALELIDFTLNDAKNINRLKEIARLREVLADYFYGTNEFRSTDEFFIKYFNQFMYACRKNH